MGEAWLCTACAVCARAGHEGSAETRPGKMLHCLQRRVGEGFWNGRSLHCHATGILVGVSRTQKHSMCSGGQRHSGLLFGGRQPNKVVQWSWAQKLPGPSSGERLREAAPVPTVCFDLSESQACRRPVHARYRPSNRVMAVTSLRMFPVRS